MDKNLGIVADIPIPPYRPLPVVLAEDFGLDVVVASGRVRISVSGGKQLHQSLHVRVNTPRLTAGSTRGNLSTGESRCADLAWREAGSGLCTFLRHLCGREVAIDFASRRHRCPEQAGIKGLFEVFKAGPEEQLLAALVEVSPRD